MPRSAASRHGVTPSSGGFGNRRPVAGPLAAIVLATGMLGAVPIAAQAQSLRPEVSKPLAAAGAALRAGRAGEALQQVRAAEAVSGRTAAETLTINKMKAAAAQRAGDSGTAIQALSEMLDSSKLSGSEQAQAAEGIAFAYSQQKNWGKTTEWIGKAQSLGGNSAQLRQLQQYVQGASGDYAAIGRDAAAAVDAAEKAGRKPGEDDLLRLADAQQKSGQAAAQVTTLEKLVRHYPKKDYWTALLGRLPRKAGFSDRYAIDLQRLQLATTGFTTADQYMELGQLALQDSQPGEALRIIDQGYKAGALGTGDQAARHQRLKDLALKQQADIKGRLDAEAKEAAAQPTGDALVKTGRQFVDQGRVDEGIKLIEQGIAKGQLKRPDDAKLRLGLAQLRSPKDKARGVQTLRSVAGADGAADVARAYVALGA